MIYPFCGLVFVGLWLINELVCRKAAKISPSTAKEMLRLGQKKHSPNPQATAAVFAISTLFIFSVWESLLRFLIAREVSVWLFVPGLVLAGFSLYFRRRSFKMNRSEHVPGTLFREDIALLVCSWTLLMGSGCALVLVPWVYWRVRRLPLYRAMALMA